MSSSESVKLAVIGLVGLIVSAVISAVVSYKVSRDQTIAAIEHLREELKSNYYEKVLDKRLDAYPSFDAILNRIDADLKSPSLQYSALRKVRGSVDEWIDRYSVIVSPPLLASLRGLQEELAKIANRNAGKKEIVSDVDRRVLSERIESLQSKVRDELGITAIPNYHSDGLQAPLH